MPRIVPITKIVSGGQTGVDRAALDAAVYLQIAHGGWCPKGRVAEDGTIPKNYQLTETASSEYRVRTEQNVIDSCGTLILYYQKMSGGTKLTKGFARKHAHPCLAIDLTLNQGFAEAHDWLQKNAVTTLNVAGPRESSHPGIADVARQFLVILLGENLENESDETSN